MHERHAGLSAEVSGLYRALDHLRCAEPERVAARAREMRATVRGVGGRLAELMAFEDGVLFPFVRMHVPRLAPLVALLASEHEDFRRSFRSLEDDLGSLAAVPGDGSRKRRVVDEGTYLICLLRSHVWAERTQVYRSVEELKPRERARLARDLDTRASRHRGGGRALGGTRPKRR